MRSNTSSLGKIEETLNSICRSPSKHRAELRLQVKLPELCRVHYSASPLAVRTKMMISLADVYNSLRLTDDPYYLNLLKDHSDSGRRKLEKVRLNKKTPSSDQIKSFTATAEKIWQELGASAADYYISEVINKVLTLAGQADNSLGIWGLPSAAKRYIANVLRRVEIDKNAIHDCTSVLQTTDKVGKMIDSLLEATSVLFSGIIFVQVSFLVGVGWGR